MTYSELFKVIKSKRGNPERDDGIISYQLKGAYTKLNRYKPRISVKPFVIPVPHPRITVRCKLCAGRESNYPINAAYSCGRSLDVSGSSHESANPA